MAPGRPDLVGLLLLLQNCSTSNSLDRDRFEKRAAEKARKLLAEETEPPLTAAQRAAVDEIVKEATLDLKA